MSENPGTLELLARQLVAAMEPLRRAVSSEEAFKAFMLRLGWETAGLPPAYTSLGSAISDAVQAIEALSDDPTLDEIRDLLVKSKAAYEAIQGITTAPPGVDAGAFLAEIGERLFEILLTDYLAAEQPAAFNLLSVLNVIEVENVPATAQKRGHIRTHFKWGEIPKIITEPMSLPERVYGWGTPDLRIQLLLQHIAELFFALRFPVYIDRADELLADAYHESETGLDEDAWVLKAPFYYITIADKNLEAAFSLIELKGEGGKPPGIIIEPQIPEEFPLTFHIAPTIDLRIKAGTNAASQFGILIRPGEITIKYPFQPGTTPPSAGIGVGFDFNPPAPALLFGSPGATRLEFRGSSLDLGASSVNGEFDVLLGAQLKGLALVLAAGEGDSFIQKILGSGESRVEIPLGFEWSRRHGVRFTGSGAFEVSVHPHLHLGPISIDEVTVSLTVPSSHPPDVRIDLGAGISGELGPLQFFVRGVGLRTDATFARGNLGPLDVRLGFKPPDGIGLSIDAGGFKGGGFLIFDSAKGEYAGGLELEFQGIIDVKALGILNTKLPDGSPGFSLLILITTEFPPIQLSFGFTLLGVGGLLGLNRTVMLEVLRAGVHDGSLQSVLFPQDIVVNAPRIINDLKRIFPPLDGRFLIGPMAKLGWGTPTLISIELGLILEIPRPAFAILGVLRVSLPAEEVPILNLQVNFLGVVDFDKGQLSFDASLIDSHLLTFTLTGDMALRLYWSEDANFLLTVGGFHPAYTPPPMALPALQRLGIVIFQGNPNLRAEAYFAITSNTAQFGAKIELHAGASVFNVYGFLALDVLIQFNPLHFVAEVAAMLAVRSGSSTLFSVRLHLMLEGPTPWHAAGKASFEIGFVFTITITVHFDVTFGDVVTTILPPIEVLPKLLEALQNPGNWRALLPAATSQRVSLRELPSTGAALVLHPFGTLEVSQKVVPLNLTISRFGTQRPQNGTNFRIAAVQLGVETVTDPASAKEQFAPAQFIDMSDAEKLSRKSFERYDAGIQIGGGDAPNADYVVSLDVVYEVIYIPVRQLRVFFRLATAFFDSLIRGSAVSRSPLAFARRAPSPLATPRVAVENEKFAVAATRDLSLHDQKLIFDSEAEAQEALNRLTTSDAGLAREWQVIPIYQLKAAA
jgi:hypothetical protein